MLLSVHPTAADPSQVIPELAVDVVNSARSAGSPVGTAELRQKVALLRYRQSPWLESVGRAIIVVRQLPQ